MRPKFRIASILVTVPNGRKVTLVLGLLPEILARNCKSTCYRGRALILLLFFAGLAVVLVRRAQASESGNQCPQTTAALYARIRTVGLDPQRVYHIREASIDRPNLHLDFDDGTLAFTEDICGHITGAFFEGDGEVRLRPPNHVERGSLALFTGMAILEEQFTSAYLRFNDNTAASLQPYLSPASDGIEFVKIWGETSRNFAEFDALRLLMDFSHFMPTSGGPEPEHKFVPLLHSHLIGKKLGGFEVFWDKSAPEPLWAGQPRIKDNLLFFDIWTSFDPASSSAPAPAPDVAITAYKINASVQPPTALQASTELNLHVRDGGRRAILFELSRFLKIDAVHIGGNAIDFIQNPAIEGSQLQRRGNDLVAVVFPAPLVAGQDVKLHFHYAGDVLSIAGSGLLYVGARGTWYPNLGLAPAQFDMEFRYPSDWTLVATGKETSKRNSEPAGNTDPVTEKVSRWISDRPIPLAGFNLGKYVKAEAKSGRILVSAYSTRGVEKSFPKAQPQLISPPDFGPHSPQSRNLPMIVATPPPSPARDLQAVADKAAKSIGAFSQWFGPYPYDSLSLTQMPGDLSQGWPGLVFLSSFAFLSPEEQTDLHLDQVTRDLQSQVLVHETAHQWWGDLVLWSSYRDQWIAEGLANYASLLLLEEKNPAQFREVMAKYRRDLLSVNKDGERLHDAGPVTLGQRLESSHFPSGYEEVSYGRGTWLFHMLRCMLRDAESGSHSRKEQPNSAEPFFRVLRKVREHYEGKRLSTQDLIHAFEEELPRSLWYEKRAKLDWFLDGWINGTAIPEISAEQVHIAEKAGMTTVTGTIVQKDAPEDLVTAIPVYGVTTTNAQIYLGIVLADGAETPFHLSAPADVHKIVLDPRQTILAIVK